MIDTAGMRRCAAMTMVAVMEEDAVECLVGPLSCQNVLRVAR